MKNLKKSTIMFVIAGILVVASVGLILKQNQEFVTAETEAELKKRAEEDVGDLPFIIGGFLMAGLAFWIGKRFEKKEGG